MADRAFDLFITDADLIDVIGEIEGKAWVALQRIDELSPTTVTANLDAFNVLRDMGAQAEGLTIADILDGGGVILGLPGAHGEPPARYIVHSDGGIEISMRDDTLVRHLTHFPPEDVVFPVGMTWMEPKSTAENDVRWTIKSVGKHPTTGERTYVIAAQGSNIGTFVSQSDIGRVIYNDQRNYDARVKARAQLRAEQAGSAEAARWLGFTDKMTPMQRAKADRALGMQMRINGKITSRGRAMYDRVRQGWRVRASKMGLAPVRVLQQTSEPGTYLLEKDVSKTALDFAEHLADLSDRGSLPAEWPEYLPS